MLQDITARSTQDFISARLAEGVSKTTVNRRRATLSTLLNCARAWGYYGGDNPVSQVKRFAESPGRARFLSPDEATRLIECVPRHLKPVVIAALQTGGRRRELLQPRWEDVDLERGVLYFDQTNTKSGRQRGMPISTPLATELRGRRRVRAIGGDARELVFTRHGKRLGSITTSFETARRRAQLGEEATFHTLRHNLCYLAHDQRRGPLQAAEVSRPFHHRPDAAICPSES
ncbi:MAG: tyrosine-type recombinase/integrase [Acidobacteriota bacterium]